MQTNLHDIHVFLEPLMEDMKKLWEQGIEMWDATRKGSLTLYAIIFETINDNSAPLNITS